MSVTMYDGVKIELPLFDEYRHRADYVMDNILNKKPYSSYYNLFSGDKLSEEDEDRLVDRWLGVKRVGNPDTNDSLKSFVDYLTGYILRADEYGNSQDKKEFLKLSTKEDLSVEEKERLLHLESDVVYKKINKNNVKASIVLLENVIAEESMRKRLLELKSYCDFGYSESFIYKDIDKRLKRCNEIKRLVGDCVDEISKRSTQIKEIQRDIYSQSNISKISVLDVETIMNNVKKLNKVKDDINDYRYRIKELSEEYVSYTELFTSVG